MNSRETETREAPYDRHLENHLSLNHLLDEIRQTKDLENLLPMLSQLRLELQAHFEQEEGPAGFGAAVSEVAPHKAEAVNKLFNEHAKFLQSLHRLQDAANACLTGPIAEVQASSKKLCQKIQDHELAENDLLGEAMNTDFGGRG